MMHRVSRWGPLSGVAFVVLMVGGFLIAGNSPDPDGSSAKIARYLADSSHYNKNMIAFFMLLAAMLFLLGFFAALRARLVAVEGGSGAGALAFGAGVASTVFLIIAISMFVAPLFAAHDAPRHVLEPGIYRLTQDLGYPIWVASVVVGSLAVWATAAVTLQTRTLPRWFGWFSVVVGVLCLFALFFFPIFLFWLWILIASIVMFLRPVVVPVAPARV
jgi:hypothetical protein